MNRADARRILLVDDDPNILASYKRYHGRYFALETAQGGAEGLKCMQEKGPYAVVVSDLRMPHMDGIQFLAEARTRAPDTVRIMLTGHADLNAAIQIVNEGYIFRFLTKPCPPEAFAQALRDGLEQYRLVVAERELLNNTLKGSIKVLVDIITMLRPEAMSRAIRIRKYAVRIAARVGIKHLWQMDVAALLSQIGCVMVAPEILKKRAEARVLTAEEQQAFVKHLEIGKALLANIPRLEQVAEGIAYQEKHFDGGGLPPDTRRGKDIPFIARVLKVLLDFDDAVSVGKGDREALEVLRARRGQYDPDVLAALHAELLEADAGYIVKEISASEVTTGMVLAEDLRTRTNLLLLPRRHEISEPLRVAIQNFALNRNLVEPIRILHPVESVY